MKKISYIIIAAMLSAAMLSACGEPSGGLDGNNNDKVTEESESRLDVSDSFVQIMIKSKTTVNVRKGPAFSYKSLGMLERNDLLVYLGTEGKWYKTEYKGINAYISANALHTELVTMEKSMINAVENVISIGYPLLGYPYVWGSERYHWGNGVLNSKFESGKFDCSALTQYIFYHGAKVLLGLTTREQVLQGEFVEKSKIQRGDLLFFTNSSRYYKSGIERVGHVAIYLGNNYILHTASDHAVIEPISSLRWTYYITARRFL